MTLFASRIMKIDYIIVAGPTPSILYTWRILVPYSAPKRQLNPTYPQKGDPLLIYSVTYAFPKAEE